MRTQKIILGLFALNFLVSFSKEQKIFLRPSKQSAVTAIPLYRLVDPYGYHFYTTNEAEKNATIKDLGYKDEGILGYVFPWEVKGTVPLFRYRSEFDYIIDGENNQIARIARHFYTTNQNDPELSNNYAGSYVWEGIQCYVIPNINDYVPPPSDAFAAIYWLSKGWGAKPGTNNMNPGTFDNLYTNNEEEKFSAVYSYHYRQMSIAFIVCKTAAISK